MGLCPDINGSQSQSRLTNIEIVVDVIVDLDKKDLLLMDTRHKEKCKTFGSFFYKLCFET